MEDKQLRPSWKGILAVIGGTVLIGLLFLNFGRLELARPAVLSLIVIIYAFARKWELRRHVWFWITMTVIAALHIPLILCVPWTTKWVPVFVIIPFGFADLALILAIIKLLEKQFEKRTLRDVEASSPS
jgi:hypothetical protein